MVDRLTSDLLSEHRSWDGRGVLTRLDGMLHSDAEEILDSPDLDAPTREHAMRLLHLANRRIGSYGMWEEVLDECLAGLDAAHVYDLAAGTGGFALHLAQSESSTRQLTLTSSDLDAGYVAEGARQAREAGLDVRFDVHDALLLSDLRGVDLFVCTQAAHHFAAGRIVRMIHQATRAATRGLLIIDLLRGATAMLGTGALLSLVAPHHILVRDGLLSVRRAWLPGELDLLARIAGASHVEARAFGPAHCLMHAFGRGETDEH